MSNTDTWSDIQDFRNKRSSLRERMKKRQRDLANIMNPVATSADSEGPNKILKLESVASPQASADLGPKQESAAKLQNVLSAAISVELEIEILQVLADLTVDFPIESDSLLTVARKPDLADLLTVNHVLQKYHLKKLIEVKDNTDFESGSSIVIESANHDNISAIISVLKSKVGPSEQDSQSSTSPKDTRSDKGPPKSSKVDDLESIGALLSLTSTKEREDRKLGSEIAELLSRPTAKEKSLARKFRSAKGSQVQEFCAFGTKTDCGKQNGGTVCSKLHFRKIIQDHTDTSLGDCSFLNTCFHMDTCKFIHYEVDYGRQNKRRGGKSERDEKGSPEAGLVEKDAILANELPVRLFPQQWIQCDLRSFDLQVLGKFAVVMADPPWDIHMELPYGTMSDDEMRSLNVQCLQDQGLIFLWVTGRAMELGRDCLRIWGYQQCDEIIWVKTNQLQRIIRTGRTGHWINHGKEHCLVGLKGSIELYNRGLDCDVIVSEVRETSHKPDEIYGIIERLSPGTRKLELFGRMHNAQPNWVTLGNQLDGVKLLDPELVHGFKSRYPDGNCIKKPSAKPNLLPPILESGSASLHQNPPVPGL